MVQMCLSIHLSKEFLFLQWVHNLKYLFQIDEQNKTQNNNLSSLKQKNNTNSQIPINAISAWTIKLL